MEQHISDKDLIRFMSKVKSFAPGECWEWNGYKKDTGYGQFGYQGKVWRAHRFAYMLVTGRKPGEAICHSCDNPSCVNPDHLWEGTQIENMLDRDKKGRGVLPPIRCGDTYIKKPLPKE